MIGKLAFGVGALSAAVGVLLSMNSLGPQFGWNRDGWQAVGVNPQVVKEVIQSYPEKHCEDRFKPLCAKISSHTLYFLGFTQRKPGQ